MPLLMIPMQNFRNELLRAMYLNASFKLMSINWVRIIRKECISAGMIETHRLAWNLTYFGHVGLDRIPKNFQHLECSKKCRDRHYKARWLGKCHQGNWFYNCSGQELHENIFTQKVFDIHLTFGAKKMSSKFYCR